MGTLQMIYKWLDHENADFLSFTTISFCLENLNFS